MKIPALLIYTICYLIFLYTPIVILPIFAFNNSTAVAFPLQGFTTEWFYNIAHDDTLFLWALSRHAPARATNSRRPGRCWG
jgi:spermidine/putrescine transport system permease protein